MSTTAPDPTHFSHSRPDEPNELDSVAMRINVLFSDIGRAARERGSGSSPANEARYAREILHAAEALAASIALRDRLLGRTP